MNYVHEKEMVIYLKCCSSKNSWKCNLTKTCGGFFSKSIVLLQLIHSAHGFLLFDALPFIKIHHNYRIKKLRLQHYLILSKCDHS